MSGERDPQRLLTIFLERQPQWLPTIAYRHVTWADEPQMHMTGHCLRAFIEWGITMGFTDEPADARALLEDWLVAGEDALYYVHLALE
jgi:hypothetical protein